MNENNTSNVDNTTHKIGILIPCTSNGREWKNFKDTYLFNITMKSFLLTYNKEHNYIFYIGVDRNDPIFDNKKIKKEFVRFIQIMKNTDIRFYYVDEAAKGHLTKMWNILFKIAYKDNCDYYFQCGDDIEFCTKGWINDCINTLKKNNNVGICGPINNNMRILTQCFVSKKHYEIFNYFFPEEIINWCCDDWINDVYKPHHFFPVGNHYCDNKGGKPRYLINNDHEFSGMQSLNELRRELVVYVERDKEKIKKYLN